MPDPRAKQTSYFHRMWQRFMGQIVQDVPEDYQACEFECRKLQCMMGDWERCERRLEAKAQNQDQA